VLTRAGQLAVDLGHHLFDTLYHAVALEPEACLVTADDRYHHKARALPGLRHLRDWRGRVAAPVGKPALCLAYIVSGIVRCMTDHEKPLLWIGSSKKDLIAIPLKVRKLFGHALDFAQHGEQHAAAKLLKGFGGAGVLEVVEDDAGGTYRAVYTVKFVEAVFVLHCFKKKSRSGMATPKGDIELIRARLKVAEAIAQEMRNDKSHH
jgi:phage-related protein